MSGPNELERAMKGHVLDQAELKVSTAEDAGFDRMMLGVRPRICQYISYSYTYK